MTTYKYTDDPDKQIVGDSATTALDEARLQLALEAAGMGTWHWTVGANKDTRDAGLNRILGLEPVNSMQSADDFLNRVDAEDRERVYAAIIAAVELDAPFDEAFRVIRPDGEIRWIRDRGRIIQRDTTPVMTGVVMDITDLRQAVEARQRAAARALRHQAIASALAETVTSIDVANVIVREAQGALDANAVAIFTLEGTGTTVTMLANQGFPPELIERFARFRLGLPSPILDAITTRDLITVETADELNARWPNLADLRARTGQAALVAVPLLLEHSVLGVFCAAFQQPRTFDPDERAFLHTLGRQCALALERARLYEAAEEARYRAEFLAQASDVLASSLDISQTLAQVAHLAVPMIGDWCGIFLQDSLGTPQLLVAAQSASEPTTCGAAITEALLSDPAATSGVHAVLRTGQAELVTSLHAALVVADTHDTSYLEKLQDTGCQALMAVPLIARNQVLGVLSFASLTPGRAFRHADLIEAKELGRRTAQALDNARLYQDAQTAIQTRDTFFSVAAHELRTPLTTLLGQSQLLRRRIERGDLNPERVVHSATTIADQAERLNTLITNLLDLTRMEQGRLTIEQGQVNLGDLLCQVVEELRPTLADHTLTLQLPPEPLIVAGDPLRLEQVIQNLLSNAIKYSPVGGPVEVRLWSCSGQACFSVQDHGIGIPSSAFPRLFQRFNRSDRPAIDGIPGIGIGLYVVKEIVERHNGTVDVVSVEGVGSTFTVSLPLAS